MLDLNLLKSLVRDALAKETPETLDAFLSDYPDYVPFAERGIEAFIGKYTTEPMKAFRTSFAPMKQSNEQVYGDIIGESPSSPKGYNMAA